MSSDTFNIFERIIVHEMSSPYMRVFPRILVHRTSISPAELSHVLSECLDEPRFPVSSLLGSTDEATDLASYFSLDPLANRVKRDVIELLFSRYSSRSRDSQSRACFTFSTPTPTDNAHILYYFADFGFLAQHSLLCRYEGSFDSPSLLEFRLLQQS